MTPLSGDGKNPSFTTFDLDAETMLPVEKTTFYFNLAKANQEGTPTWESVDHRTEFELEDLSPTSMMNLANRVLNDHEFTKQWIWFQQSYAFEKPTEVKKKDRVDTYCGLASSESWENSECSKTKGEKRSAYGVHNKINDLDFWFDYFLKCWIN